MRGRRSHYSPSPDRRYRACAAWTSRPISEEIEQRYGDLLKRMLAAGREMTARAAVDFALGSGSASARQ